jgi:hypothetical protein
MSRSLSVTTICWICPDWIFWATVEMGMVGMLICWL